MPKVCSISEGYTDPAGLTFKVWLLIFPTLTFPFSVFFKSSMLKLSDKTYPNIVIIVNLTTSSTKQEDRQEMVIKICQKQLLCTCMVSLFEAHFEGIDIGCMVCSV